MMRRLTLAALALTCAFGAWSGQASAQRTIPVSIESTPPGATVFFDSTEQRIGVTPLSNVRLPVGQHTLDSIVATWTSVSTSQSGSTTTAARPSTKR